MDRITSLDVGYAGTVDSWLRRSLHAALLVGALPLCACATGEAAKGDRKEEPVASTRQALGSPGVTLYRATMNAPQGPSSWTSTVSLYGVQTLNHFDVPGTALAVAAGDMNADGGDEVVVAWSPPTQGTGTVQVYGEFGQIRPFPWVSGWQFSPGDGLALADVDKDGVDDVIVANQSTEGVHVFTKNGALNDFFGPSRPQFVAGSNLVSCDLNNDGFDEVIIADSNFRIFTHPSVTDPSIRVPSYFGGTPPLMGSFARLACADLNNDGFDDLIIGRRDNSCIQVVTHPSRPPIVFVRDPSSTEQSSDCVRFTANDEIEAGDLNFDGFAEIIVGRTNSIGNIALFPPNGHALSPFFVSGSTVFPNGSVFAVGRHSGSSLDSDDDGLIDSWETNGFDWDKDRCVDLDLPALGANPFRKDIFVEIDAMDCATPGSDCAGDPLGSHNHVPTAAAIDAIVRAFDEAPIAPPVGAPPGTRGGINLHVDLGTADRVMHSNLCEMSKLFCSPKDFCDVVDPLIGCSNDTPSCFDRIKLSFFGTANDRAGIGPACAAGVTAPTPAQRKAAILSAKGLVYHYNLWAHSQEGGPSGIGEGAARVDCPAIITHPDVNEEAGNDFMVTLYNFGGKSNGQDLNQSAVFMHELGHNLGLDHGGNEAINFKPNYLSAMNYAFSLDGIPQEPPATGPRRTPIVDYSRRALPTLNEFSLNENLGVQGPSAFTFLGALRDDQTQFTCPNGTLRTSTANKPIDWSCNGVSTQPDVFDDVNGDRLCVQQVGTRLDTSPVGDDFVSAGWAGKLWPGPDGWSQSGRRHSPDPRDVVRANSIDAGSDLVLQTPLLRDDAFVQRIDPGAAGVVLSVPATARADVIVGFIAPGPDGNLQTPRDANDVAGTGNTIQPGPDGELQTTPLAGTDDQRVIQRILPGADLRLDTLPSPQDVLVNQLIVAGMNGVLESTLTLAGVSGDDFLSGEKVLAGPDNIFQTRLAGDDIFLDLEIVDRDRACLTTPRGDDIASNERWDGEDRELGDIQPASITGFDDWSNLKYLFRDKANFSFGVHYSVVHRKEPTASDYERQKRLATRADVQVTATATPSSPTAGSPFSYRISIKNNGPEPASQIAISAQLSTGVTFGACVPSTGAHCTAGGGTVQGIEVESLAVGQTVTADVTATASCTLAGTNVVLSGMLTTGTTDPVPANNVLNAQTAVAGPAPVFTTVQPELVISQCTNVTLPNPFVKSACGTATLTNNRPAKFPLGRTIVTWTAAIPGGGTITTTQAVTAVLGDDASCCPTGTNVINGTSNNDTLNGTTTADCILGKGAQDTINGNGGNDVISGGDGNDILNGGDGDDRIYGGTGQDTLSGQNGNDTLDGRDGDDICRGGIGNDALYGAQGQDQLFGEDGADSLYGQDGDDTLNGGTGNDYLEGGRGANDQCDGGTGTNLFALCETAGLLNSCQDGVRDGGETAVDCGGGGCRGCGSGIACNVGNDCLGGVCTNGTCLAPLGPVQAALVVTSDWGAGYCVQIEATNVDTAPLNGWGVTLETNQSQIFSTSNGVFDAASGVVHVTPSSGYTSIALGGTQAGVGFCANRSASGAFPVVLAATGAR